MKTTMSNGEKRLVAHLLQELSEQLSNRCCNDFNLNRFMSPDEIEE